MDRRNDQRKDAEDALHQNAQARRDAELEPAGPPPLRRRQIAVERNEEQERQGDVHHGVPGVLHEILGRQQNHPGAEPFEFVESQPARKPHHEQDAAGPRGCRKKDRTELSDAEEGHARCDQPEKQRRVVEADVAGEVRGQPVAPVEQLFCLLGVVAIVVVGEKAGARSGEHDEHGSDGQERDPDAVP